MTQCKGRVTRGWRTYCCSRPAQEGSKFCFQHDPVAKKAKQEARHAEWQRKWDADRVAKEQAAKRVEFANAAELVLTEIANGHNDPRKLAKKALEILK